MRNYVMMVEAKPGCPPGAAATPSGRGDSPGRGAGRAAVLPLAVAHRDGRVEEIAQAAKILMEAYAAALMANVVTEDEVRAQLGRAPRVRLASGDRPRGAEG